MRTSGRHSEADAYAFHGNRCNKRVMFGELLTGLLPSKHAAVAIPMPLALLSRPMAVDCNFHVSHLSCSRQGMAPVGRLASSGVVVPNDMVESDCGAHMGCQFAAICYKTLKSCSKGSTFKLQGPGASQLKPQVPIHDWSVML